MEKKVSIYILINFLAHFKILKNPMKIIQEIKKLELFYMRY